MARLASDAEALALAQAMYKALGAIVSTRDPDSLRGRIDATMRERFESEGIDRMRLTINGTEVGRLSAKVSKRTREVHTYINDGVAFSRWMQDNEDAATAFAEAHRTEFARWAVENLGEVPDGVIVEARDVPGGFAGTTLTGCTPERVRDALGADLPEAMAGLLAGEVGE